MQEISENKAEEISERREVDSMKEVDARGLSCPEPLMMTADALKNEKGPVKVLVSMQRAMGKLTNPEKLDQNLRSLSSKTTEDTY